MLKSAFSDLLEAGTDEAGRGCLAGPVTAAAVILPKGFQLDGLNDSKQLSATKRDALKEVIKSEALSYAVAHVFPETIDKINILNASILAMHQALEKLAVEPEYIAVDGNRFKPFNKIPFSCVIKGDSKYQNIAAASVLAKTSRDQLMADLHKDFPHYHWNRNKGYPTLEHRQAIRVYGATDHHRKTFRLIPEQLKLDF